MVLGAVVCNIMFWKLNKIPSEYSFVSIIILGLSVWIIYVMDRLLDNQKDDLIKTERHLFHQINRKTLWVCVSVCTLMATILLFYISSKIIIFGIVIALITGVYLLMVNQISAKHPFQHFKEPITAFVYSAAVWGTASVENLTLSNLIFGIIFLLITFQNLLLFSYFEIKTHPETYNLAQFLGIKFSKNIILGIFLTIIILGSFSFVILTQNYQFKVLLVEILMSFSLCLIVRFQAFTLQNERFRWLGDGIFLLPLLIIF